MTSTREYGYELINRSINEIAMVVATGSSPVRGTPVDELAKDFCQHALSAHL